MCTCKVWVSLKPKAKVAFKVPFRFTKGPIGHSLWNKLSLRHIGLSDLETTPPTHTHIFGSSDCPGAYLESRIPKGITG